MSSNLKVNSLVPATGTEIGIGTTGGSIDFRCPATFGGNVTIGGTLTYDEVINIDSIGVITARSNIDCNGSLDVDGHTNLDNVSIAGITTFSNGPIVPNGQYYRGIINSGSQEKIIGGYISGTDTLRIGESMYLTSNGLGIGENSPEEELHITAATPVIRLEDSDTSRQSQIVGVDGNLRFDADNNNAQADSNISFRTDGSERLRIDSSGRVLIGHNSSLAIGGGDISPLQVSATSAVVFGGVRYVNSSSGPFLSLSKSRATTAGSNTIVQSGDDLGTILFSGDDGTDLISKGAQIQGQVDGTPGSNDMPGRLVFSTTADGAASPTERLRIDKDGKVGINSTSPTQILDVYGNIRGNILYLDRHGSPTINMTSTSDTGGGAIYFGSPASGVRGGILYDHNGDNLKIRNIYGTSIEIDNTRKSIFYGDIHGVHDGLAVNIFESNDNHSRLRIRSGDSSLAQLEFADQTDADAGEIRYDHDNERMTIHVGNNDEKLRITSAGLVGVNNIEPEGKGIDVAHSRTNGYSETTDTRNLAHIIARNSSDAVGRFAALSFINGGGTQAEGSINLVQTGNYTGDLTFKIRTAVSTWAERLRITSTGNTRIGIPPTNGSSSLIDEKQATIGTKHFYTVYHNFSSTNSPLAVNSKIPHPACGTVEVVAGWSNGNGLRLSKFHWTSSGSTSGCVQIFTTTANRYGVSVSIGTPTMSISGDYTNFSFTFSDSQGSKMEKLKIHFEYFNQFRIDG